LKSITEIRTLALIKIRAANGGQLWLGYPFGWDTKINRIELCYPLIYLENKKIFNETIHSLRKLFKAAGVSQYDYVFTNKNEANFSYPPQI
jgi:hypothetical protein